MTLAKLARDLGVDQSYLASRIGDLRANIVQKGREMPKAKRAEQVRSLAAEMHRARESLVERNLRPSARQVAKLLQVNHTSALMRQTLKLASFQSSTLTVSPHTPWARAEASR